MRPVATYRGRWRVRSTSCTDFCHALISFRPVAGKIRLVGPKRSSVSTLAIMSRDSLMMSFSSGHSKMGAIFFPTNLVGVATSSLAKKCKVCLMFFTPIAKRTRTQKGQ